MNFIVVDDIEFFRNKIKENIIKFSFSSSLELNYYIFDEYNTNFKKISKSSLENKIYILDIETPKNNGINIARQIRKTDEGSTIIFLTSYEDTYSSELLRSSLNFRFVSKNEMFSGGLIDCFKIVEEGLTSSSYTITFKDMYKPYSIKYEDILYIKAQNKKTIIKTINKEIETRKTLDWFLKNLPEYFLKSHRSCIVNANNIFMFRKKIVFQNGDETELLSKGYKPKLKEFFKMK